MGQKEKYQTTYKSKKYVFIFVCQLQTENMLSTLDPYNFNNELTWAVACIRGRNSLPDLRLRERKREEKLYSDSNDKNF